MDKDTRIKLLSVILSILFFAISLSQPVFYETARLADDNYGISALLFGWLVAFSGGAALTWLANPALVFSWITVYNVKVSFYSSFLAAIISFSFMFFDYIKDGGQGGGTDYQVIFYDIQIYKLGLGYYFWLLSSFLMCLCNLVRWKFYHLF